MKGAKNDIGVPFSPQKNFLLYDAFRTAGGMYNIRDNEKRDEASCRMLSIC